jgi:thymidylate kinase
MIVEFIGSTGAGKTTLIQQILHTCEREGINAVVGTDFVLQQSRLNGVKSHLVRTVLINLISLFASLAAWRNNRVYYRFVLQTLIKLPGAVPWSERFFLAKNILKRIGIYEIIRHHGSEQQMYLVDEGTLHVAHSLFVQTTGEANSHDLAIFASIVPLPHIVVYIRQDEAVLVERLLARGHQRVPDNSIDGATHFVRQAVNVFDKLVQDPAIEKRLVVVDGAQKNVTAPGYGSDPLPSGIAQFVQTGLQAFTESIAVLERQSVY